MIDIHSHILPGLDDGSRSMEESLAMLAAACEAGTTDIVATPHANIEFQFDPAAVDAAIAGLAAVSGGTVNVHRGCDFHLYYENINDALANPGKYTINGKTYLLVEFPDVLISRGTREIFARLLDAGITPIITHPERNFLLHTRLAELQQWVEDGALVQVTAQSYLGRFGREARRFAGELMSKGLVHFVASDAHDAEDRTPRLDAAYRHVADRYGKDRADLLFEVNPKAAIEGAPLPPQEQPREAARRKWWQFR